MDSKQTEIDTPPGKVKVRVTAIPAKGYGALGRWWSSTPTVVDLTPKEVKEIGEDPRFTVMPADQSPAAAVATLSDLSKKLAECEAQLANALEAKAVLAQANEELQGQVADLTKKLAAKKA
jgi:hypothetical protein